MNKFLRTASMRSLLAVIGGIVLVIAGGTAIALAASGGGPVPKHRRLAVAIRDALAAKPVRGISADVSFTDRLIDTSEIQGSDPLLTGGSGHVWISADGRLRLELYGDNGDPEIVVTHSSWMVYDPTLNTIYKGKLPAGASQAAAHTSSKSEALPSVAQIQTELNTMAQHLKLSGAIPSDVGGRPTYTIKVSPRHAGGLIGQLQLAWDAYKGVPLRFAVYARGDRTPVLELAVTNVSYAKIGRGTFNIRIHGPHVVNVAMPATAGGAEPSKAAGKNAKKQPEITGVKAVARRLSFKLAAPAKVAGMPRQSVSLLDGGTHAGALVTYGEGLGGVVVIEQPATANSSRMVNLSSGSGDHANGLTLPTVKIKGATAQELDTALGTILRFTSDNVTYIVMGSVSPAKAKAAARAL